MKKLLGIVVLVLLLSGNAYANDINQLNNKTIDANVTDTISYDIRLLILMPMMDEYRCVPSALFYKFLQ